MPKQHIGPESQTLRASNPGTSTLQDSPAYVSLLNLANQGPTDSPSPRMVIPPRASDRRSSSPHTSQVPPPNPLHPSAARWPKPPTSATEVRSEAWTRALARRMPRPPARLFINHLLGPELPDFSRLDIPDGNGRSIFVDSRGELEIRENPVDATIQAAVTTDPEERLPNARYDGYPMVIQVGRRPCVLYGPPWTEDTGSLLSGDPIFLSDQELEERRRCRESARRDIARYFAPAWLAQYPDTDE
ncbi:MAG: hypothetical protein Q9219_002662 [cf. Caloplaca sp. 3 TL-2023]